MPSILRSRLQSQSVTSDNSVPDPARAEAHRILAIEDDSATQRVLKRLFESEGYDVDMAKDGASGLELFHKTRPSAIILDLRLPDISGREVCRQITRVAPGLPVIVLSATADVADKIVLLEIGARDYVTKPFSPRELLARVRTALRSAQADLANVFCFDDVTVNFPNAEVMRGGRSVGLTAKEFKALKFMIQNAGRVISRHELLNEVWGYHDYPHTRTVDTHILSLRNKLERDPSNPIHFRTLSRVGYKFVA
jgi:two-component system, OmpR family, alkaline phosphatase synthesis response regulator PhoP